MNIAIDDIRLSGDNMREDVGEIDELSWSIRKHGILQPLLVTKREGGYLLVCGHRRLAAARRAGLTEVPCVEKDMTDDERFELMIVENVHRKHLSPLEEAHAFEKMIAGGALQVDIATRIGKSQMYVSARMSLLKCDPEIQQKVHKGELSLYKAIDETRSRYTPRPDRDQGDRTLRWQIYYIDRLVGWLEAGRIDLQDGAIFDRLSLLSRTLKALPDRARLVEGSAGFGHDDGEPDEDDPHILENTPMCNRCGTVKGYIRKCCDDHDQELCPPCVEETHVAA